MASMVSFGYGNHGLQVGQNFAPITTEVHLPPERQETPPSASSTVPFRRDQEFVERGALCDQIYQRCAVIGSWTALVGLGGVGKSQLAIEYAHRIREQSPEKWVFWVHASNAARFEQSYREIADTVKIFGRQNPKANIFKLVHDWLHDGKKGKWIIILDNIDDAHFLLNAQNDIQGQPGDSDRALKPLREYLPQSQNGSILMTSRSMEAVLKLVERGDVVTVEPMDEAQALALFEAKLGKQGDNEDTAKLVASLEFMPLAIVQAAAYISQRAPRCSVRYYLGELQKSDRKKTSLLEHKGGHLRRDREAENSIIITWQISFNYILQTRPSAADLLSLMSFFDRQVIPEALLRNRTGQGNVQQDRRKHNRNNNRDDDEDSVSRSSVSNVFEDDILALRNYSFVSVNANKTTFEMHRMVQLATRKWLEANCQLEKWKQQYIKNLCAAFPTGNFENWAECQTLFPHAKSAVSQRPEDRDSLIDWASILYRAAWYALGKGNSADAEKMSGKAMNMRKKLFGQEHKETLSSMAMVGLVHKFEGRWKEAEQLQVQVMEISSRVLGEEHPHTLTSIGNLASTYRNQGRWKEAEQLQVQVMEIMKRMLGEEHPHTLTSIANLASTYRNQGRWKEAEQLEVQVTEIRKRVLGEEHPHTLNSIGSLASTYQNQGRWKEAEQLQVQVMEISSRVLGEEHPHTLTSIGSLASTSRNQGRWKEAEQLEVQVTEIRKRVLGEEHPHTLTSIGSLASTYRNQGRWKEAEQLQVQVMEIMKRVLGEEHPHTLTSIANLASTYRSQGRWKEAEQLYMQVMEIRKRVLGEEHPDTLTSMANLAFTLEGQSRSKEAITLMTICFQLRIKILSPRHPDVYTSLEALNKWDDKSKYTLD
ncbi:hypothetical protein MMC21_001682 [Puttea exsequens]|nr:hypothetical protein [Puttea exsequens]